MCGPTTRTAKDGQPMRPTRNKVITALFNSPGFDPVRGESAVFEMYSAHYPSDFPPVTLGATNGHSFLRHNSPLCTRFMVRKIYANGDVEEIHNGAWRAVSLLDKERQVPIPSGVQGRALIGWWTRAFAPASNIFKAPIPVAVRKALKGQPCVFSGGKAEHIDHKYGRQDQAHYPQSPDASHYQPASKGDNTRKREHCNRCRETDQRFDARTIPGMPQGWVAGGARFEHNREGCHGCYQFDPVAFRKALFTSKPKRGSSGTGVGPSLL